MFNNHQSRPSSQTRWQIRLILLLSFVFATISGADLTAATIKNGSGDFIINQGPVYSSGGTYISSGSYGSITVQNGADDYGFGYFNVIGFAGTLPPTKIISLDTSKLVWERLAVGESETRILTLRNYGNSPLQVTNISFPSGFSGEWTGQIPPYQSEAIAVTFNPTSAGTFTGNIFVDSDATGGLNTSPISASAEYAYPLAVTSVFGPLRTSPEERTYWKSSQVTMKASAVGGYLFKYWTENGKIVGKNSVLNISVTSPRVLTAYYEKGKSSLELRGGASFGSRPLNSVTERYLTLVNTGKVPVQVTGLSIATGPQGSPSAFSAYGSGIIYPGTSQIIRVSFRPTSVRQYISRITAQTSVPATGNFKIDLTGSGR